ncbi:MAG: aspartate kinase [Clostridia bacterium]|nr:aspartate kinase [Clostridia bacterium]
MNVVHKYGGTSVATIEKIQAVADRIAELKKAGNNVAVVCSAMGKTTDKLIEMAKAVGGDRNKREFDSLLSTGEQTTCALMAMALQARGVPAVSLTGGQSGFITDTIHSHATIRKINGERINQVVASGAVPVITGFQGVTADGDITTLGRGGSDTTAVAVAATLGWDCEIYTDVDGVYTIDPRRCPKAKKLDTITCDEMMELAAMGAGVLETRSVELAKKYGVNLYLGRSLEKDLTKGTHIVEKYFEAAVVTGIGVIDDCSMLSIKCEFGGDTVSRLFSSIAEMNINVDMISHQLDDKTAILSFSCSAESALEIMERMPDEHFTVNNGLAKLSLVGAGMATHSGVAAKALSTLYENGIPHYQITTSEISISITVDKDHLQKACDALAKAFDLCEE